MLWRNDGNGSVVSSEWQTIVTLPTILEYWKIKGKINSAVNLAMWLLCNIKYGLRVRCWTRGDWMEWKVASEMKYPSNDEMTKEKIWEQILAAQVCFNIQLWTGAMSCRLFTWHTISKVWRTRAYLKVSREASLVLMLNKQWVSYFMREVRNWFMTNVFPCLFQNMKSNYWESEDMWFIKRLFRCFYGSRLHEILFLICKVGILEKK